MRLLFTVPLIAVLLLTVAANAHPLDETGIGHWTDVRISSDTVAIGWTLSYSPLAAFVELKIADINGDGELDGQELTDLAYDTFERQTGSYSAFIDGQQLPLRLIAASISPELRQIAPQFFQIKLELAPAVDEPLDLRRRTISIDDQSYANRLSWARITWSVTDELADEGYSTLPDRVPAADVLPPPEDALANFAYAGKPGAQRTGHAEVRAVAETTPLAAAGSVPAARSAKESEQLVAFLKQRLSPWVALLALGTALALGGLHALSPGHGKTIVAAYLIGTKGRIRDAVTLGAVTTLTHVSSVLLIGVFALGATKFFVPEKIVPWLTVLSGLLVVGIGIKLLLERIAGSDGHGHTHSHHHGRGHSHGHIHFHGPGLADGQVHAPKRPAFTARNRVKLHESAGAPSASTRRILPAAVALRSRQQPAAGVHRPPHSGNEYSTQQQSAGRPGLRELISLGISGGVVPCPSALVVLLTAVALNRILFGLALIFAFSLGLAAVLIGLGIAVVTVTKRVVGSNSRQPKWQRPLGIFSACAVTVLGLALAVSGLVQAGIIVINL